VRTRMQGVVEAGGERPSAIRLVNCEVSTCNAPDNELTLILQQNIELSIPSLKFSTGAYKKRMQSLDLITSKY